MLVDQSSEELNYLGRLLLVNFAAHLLLQAGIKDCGCEHACDCLVVEEIEYTPEYVRIKANGKVHRLRAVRYGAM